MPLPEPHQISQMITHLGTARDAVHTCLNLMGSSPVMGPPLLPQPSNEDVLVAMLSELQLNILALQGGIKTRPDRSGTITHGGPPSPWR